MNNSGLCLLVAFSLGAASAAGQTFSGPNASFPIPDGAGTCIPGAPASTTVIVPAGYGPAATITVDMTIGHTWYGDLKLVITNPAGQFVTALVPGCEGSLDDDSDLQGEYTLSDAAPMTLDAAALARVGSVIPFGTYAPDNPLSGLLVCGGDASGAWTFTFDDHHNFDFGFVTRARVTLTPGPPFVAAPVFAFCQAGPGTPVFVTHVGGVPGALFINPVALGTGHTPSGWFLGLDIAYADLLTELNHPPGIFSGFLDGTGSFTSAPLPVPAGFVLAAVGIHIDPVTGYAVYISPAFDFTVL
jgi:hypothetical protein